MVEYTKNNFFPILLCFFLAVPILILLDGKFYSIWDLNVPAIDPLLQLNKYLSIWDGSHIGGKNSNYLAFLPYLVEVYAISFIVSHNIANALVFYLHYALCGFSMYYLVCYMYGSKPDRHCKIAACIAAYMYMYNEYWFLRGHYNFNIVFILAFLPFIFVFLHKIIHANNYHDLFSLILKTCLISILMITGLSNLPVSATLFFVFIIYYFSHGLLEKISIHILLKRFFLLGFIAIFFHAWWLTPNLFNASTQEALNRKGDYVHEIIEGLKYWETKDATAYNRIITGKGYPIVKDEIHSSYTRYSFLQNNRLIRILSFAPIFMVVLSFFSSFLRKRFSINIPYLIILLIFIPIIAATRDPFGKIIQFLAFHFPLYVFRRPPTYMFVVHLVYTIIASGFILATLKNKNFSRIAKVTFISAVVISVGVVNFPRIIGATAYMVLRNQDKTQTIHTATTFRIPNYVKNLSRFINDQKGNFGVAVLPISGMVRGYDWGKIDGGYFGFDVYSFLLNKPINSDFTYRHKINLFNVQLSRIMKRGDIITFEELLSFFNIRYVILTHDILYTPGAILYQTSKQLERFINKTNLNLVHTFGSHQLYESNNWSPLFYSLTNYHYASGINDNTIYSLFENIDKEFIEMDVPFESKHFNILDVKKYSPSKYKLVINTDTIQTNNGILATKIFFNKSWEASSNGVLFNHIKVNGLFNGWIINNPSKDSSSSKSFEIMITYKPQKVFFRIFILTIIVIMLSFFYIIIYNMKRNQHDANIILGH